jgi:indolepyruvate ferredoxin oxidoreductase, alpha subunit
VQDEDIVNGILVIAKSLSIRPNPDPLRRDPVACVLDSCVGCGLCGEIAHAAVLCPSFYRAGIVSNPSG